VRRTRDFDFGRTFTETKAGSRRRSSCSPSPPSSLSSSRPMSPTPTWEPMRAGGMRPGSWRRISSAEVSRSSVLGSPTPTPGPERTGSRRASASLVGSRRTLPPRQNSVTRRTLYTSQTDSRQEGSGQSLTRAFLCSLALLRGPQGGELAESACGTRRSGAGLTRAPQGAVWGRVRRVGLVLGSCPTEEPVLEG
jgi:hypothetical protein